MRKIIIYCLLVSGILTLVCCQGVFGVDSDPESPTTFSATIGPSASTKTTLAPADNSGTRAVLWSSGDEVFIGGKEYTLTAGAGTTSGTLEGSGAVLSEGVYKAYYPKGIWKGSGTPPELSTQVHASGRIDNLPMYAQSDGTDLTFHNLCAVLNLHLLGTGTVTRIEVKSEEHPLSGPFEVKGSEASGWYASLLSGGTNTATLTCPTAVTLSETEASDFFIALPAGTYARGKLTVEVWGTGSPSSPLKFYRNDRAPASGSVLERSRVYYAGGASSAFDLGFEEVAWDGRLSAEWPEGVRWREN